MPETPDPDIIREFGEPAIHTPQSTGIPTTVQMVVWTPHPDVEITPGVTLILFGTLADSGFLTAPIQNDSIQHRGRDYRVFSLASDSPTGEPMGDGIFLNCENRPI